MGTVEKRTFNADGQVHTIETFIPSDIRPFDLSALGHSDYKPGDLPPPGPVKKKESDITMQIKDAHEGKLAPTRGMGPVAGPTFRINDAIANGLIFTGAAVIIGSQLLKK